VAAWLWLFAAGGRSGCRRYGRGGAGSRGCGTRMPGGHPVWRAGSGSPRPRPDIKPAIATADQAAAATPVAPPHHRLPCMTVMPASRGRPRPTTGRRVSTTLGTGGLVSDSAPTIQPCPTNPKGTALTAERPTPSSPSPSASAPVSTRMTSPPHAGSWPRPPTASRVNSDGVHRCPCPHTIA